MSARDQPPDLGELLALAEQTATAAAILLAEEGAEQRPEVAATKSSLTDVVTEMDRRAEHLIRERILAARPGDTILGEEGGETQGTAGPAPPAGSSTPWTARLTTCMAWPTGASASPPKSTASWWLV